MTTVAWSCLIENCPATKHEAHGYCAKHYGRLRKGTSLVKDRDFPWCQIEGCDRRYFAKRYCYFHYARVWSGVDVERPLLENLFVDRACLIVSCANPAGTIKGLCKSHSNWAGKYKFSVVQAIQILCSGYPCGICKFPLDSSNINIDHDHECCPGQATCGECIRGFLCRSCNRGIGSMSDSLEVLVSAALYLSGSHDLRELVERLEAAKRQ